MNKKQMPKPSTMTRISFISTIMIFLGILMASLVFPLILDSLGLGLYYLRVLVIGLATGFSTSHGLFVRDAKVGYTKGFWVTFILLTILGCLISYFWVFDIYPI